MTEKLHLLLDGDVIAYKAAAAVEKALHWGEGYWTWHSDEMEARRAVEGQIDAYMDGLGGHGFTICLTDDVYNFRKMILPTYKGNRKQKRPLVLKAVREWMQGRFPNVMQRPGLEGDDIMGILATWSKFRKQHGQPVIVSIDKDMKTIPGTYVRDLDIGPVEITEAEADYWHLYQTLTGDTTDGYSGCPGIGPKKAERVLEEGGTWPPFGTLRECWDNVILPAYVKAGLSEEDALVQARVARILRASDYDFKKKEPILWKP